MKMISSSTTRYSGTGTRRSKRRNSSSRTSSNLRHELETQLDDSDASCNRLSRFTQSYRLLSYQLNLDKARAIILVATAAADDIHFSPQNITQNYDLIISLGNAHERRFSQ